VGGSTTGNMRSAPVANRPSRRVLVTAWISVAARLLLGGVLAAAAVLKLAVPPTEQVRAVRAYQLLPYGVDAVVGYTLPFVELFLAAALLLGLGTRVAAVLAGILMLAFVAGIGSVWARGISIDCGCFGGGGPVSAGETKYLEEILRDIGLVLAAGWLAVFGPGRFAVGRSQQGSDQGGR
jgi:uncharacterized membrane protein YphA (DoxX/SURF4 family)